MIACQEGHLDVVKVLVEIGRADLFQVNKFGKDALKISVQNDNMDISDYLVTKIPKGFDPYEK